MSPTSHAWIINPSLGKQAFGLGGLAGEVIEIWRCVCVPTSSQCACYWLFFWVENEKSPRGEREREEKNPPKSKQPSPTLPHHSPPQIRSWRCAVKWSRWNNGLGWKLLEPRAADYQLYWIDAGGLAGQRLSALRLRLRWSEGGMKGGKMRVTVRRKNEHVWRRRSQGFFFFLFLPSELRGNEVKWASWRLD